MFQFSGYNKLARYSLAGTELDLECEILGYESCEKHDS